MEAVEKWSNTSCGVFSLVVHGVFIQNAAPSSSLYILCCQWLLECFLKDSSKTGSHITCDISQALLHLLCLHDNLQWRRTRGHSHNSWLGQVDSNLPKGGNFLFLSKFAQVHVLYEDDFQFYCCILEDILKVFRRLHFETFQQQSDCGKLAVEVLVSPVTLPLVRLPPLPGQLRNQCPGVLSSPHEGTGLS